MWCCFLLLYGCYSRFYLIAARKLPCCTAARLNNHSSALLSLESTSFCFAQVLPQRCFDAVVISCLIRYEARACLLVAFQVLLLSSRRPPSNGARGASTTLKSAAWQRRESKRKMCCVSCRESRLFSIPSATCFAAVSIAAAVQPLSSACSSACCRDTSRTTEVSHIM